MKTDGTYVHLAGRVTPETMRWLREYHADRIRRGSKPATFTASVREVIEAGRAVLSAAPVSSETSSHRQESAA